MLLRAIAGLAMPNAGTVVLAETNVGVLSPKDRNIGMVFQHHAVFPSRTVRENFSSGLEQPGWAVRYVIDVGGVRLRIETQTAKDARYLQPGEFVDVSVLPNDMHFI